MKKILTAMILVIAVVFVFTGCNITPEPDTYTVTFDSNGGSTVNSMEHVESGSKLQKPDDPEYAGYDFKGWYKDNNLTELWDWGNDIVTMDITLYARWQERGSYPEPDTYTVTFDSNGGMAVNSIENVESGSKLQKPDDPEYAGYDFIGWYKDSQFKAPWDWKNDTVTEEITLYARWEESGPQTYIFEAEDTDLTRRYGNGWSYVVVDSSAYIGHRTDLNASSNRFVSGLYEEGCSVEFIIDSSDYVDDAVIVARLSAEFRDIVLYSDIYSISLNFSSIIYPSISLDGVNSYRQFNDFVIGTNLTLKKGLNIITFTTINEIGIDGSTVRAIAPLIDCVKLTTKATISWSASHGLPKANY